MAYNNLPYDRQFNPPAIVYDFNLTLEVKDRSATVSLRMLIDTGADRSCVPREAIEELATLLSMPKLPYSMVVVLDFDGRMSKRPAYNLKTEPTSFGKGNSFEFVLIDDEVGILGRDVLNDHRIELDGPKTFWHFWS